MKQSYGSPISLSRELNLTAVQRAMGLLIARQRRPDSEVTFCWRAT